MFYAISRADHTVNSRAEYLGPMQDHIEENQDVFGEELVLVETKDDLLMEFDFDEIVEINKSLGGANFPKDINDAVEMAAEITWKRLVYNHPLLPLIGPELKATSTKQAKPTSKPSKAAQEPGAKKASKGTSKPAKTSKRLSESALKGKVIVVGSKEPPRGRHTRIVEFVDENLEVEYEELVDFLSTENGKPSSHIIWAINQDILRIVE